MYKVSAEHYITFSSFVQNIYVNDYCYAIYPLGTKAGGKNKEVLGKSLGSGWGGGVPQGPGSLTQYY